jgi:hypothetical protein
VDLLEVEVDAERLRQWTPIPGIAPPTRPATTPPARPNAATIVAWPVKPRSFRLAVRTIPNRIRS